MKEFREKLETCLSCSAKYLTMFPWYFFSFHGIFAGMQLIHALAAALQGRFPYESREAINNFSPKCYLRAHEMWQEVPEASDLR